MSRRVVLHATPAEFLSRARPFLLAREAERSLLLGIAQSLPSDTSGPTLATVEHDQTVEAVALRCGPNKLVVSDGPSAALQALSAKIYGHIPELSGVVGPANSTRSFVQAWKDHSPAAADLRMRLHRLDAVVEPPRPAGHVRVATPADMPMLAPWGDRFIAESGSDNPSTGEQMLRAYLDLGRAYVWEDPDPRCLVGWSRSTPTGASVSVVYTPPQHRGRGYATALVAEVSAMLLARGKRFCVLFTNLENPTANAIYARIGYRPIAEHEAWTLAEQ